MSLHRGPWSSQIVVSWIKPAAPSTNSKAIPAFCIRTKFDALDQYRTSSLFNEKERAALDYVTELTRDKKADRETFVRLSSHYTEREVCAIVWLAASEHVYNMTNIGLNSHSDVLCDISRMKGTRR